MEKELICINCPKGCTLTIKSVGGGYEVSGNSCIKGKEYALSELLHPMRTLTSTIGVLNGTQSRLPVKTQKPIAKEQIFEVMKIIYTLEVEAPVQIGQVIAANIDHHQTALVACMNIERA